jgi:hypothetical protein
MIMKINTQFIIGGLLCCIIALVSGCASSQLFDIWSNSSYQTLPLNKMLVISVIKNMEHRRSWEDAFSAELEKHNVAAMSSYRLFPDVLPDTNQVIQAVQSNGFDGVLVTRWLPLDTKTHYMQGFGMDEDQMTNEYNEKYFASYFQDFNYAGNVDSQKVDIRVFDVWAIKNGKKMIWRAKSQSPEPNSLLKVRPEIVTLIVSKLTERGIIASER